MFGRRSGGRFPNSWDAPKVAAASRRCSQQSRDGSATFTDNLGMREDTRPPGLWKTPRCDMGQRLEC